MGPIKRLWRSARKQTRLVAISKRMAPTAVGQEFFQTEIERVMSGTPDPREAAEEELLDLVESDEDLREIIQAYGATRDSLRGIIENLKTRGGGQWAGGHYVPASALAFRPTLDYALTYLSDREPSRTAPDGNPWPWLGRLPPDDNKTIDHNIRLHATAQLVEYFASGKVGEVER